MSLSPEVEITQIFKNSLLNFSSITTRFMSKYMSLTPPFAIVLPLRTLVSCHVDRLQFGYYGFVFNAEGHAPFFSTKSVTALHNPTTLSLLSLVIQGSERNISHGWGLVQMISSAISFFISSPIFHMHPPLLPAELQLWWFFLPRQFCMSPIFWSNDEIRNGIMTSFSCGVKRRHN